MVYSVPSIKYLEEGRRSFEVRRKLWWGFIVFSLKAKKDRDHNPKEKGNTRDIQRKRSR